MVSRWQPDARERLRRAALELFAEQGFAATTVPGITARAGLTTRTFFRHYADKREVLFAEDDAAAYAARLLADAPAALDPMSLIAKGLRDVAESRFQGRRDELRVRREIVAGDEGLRERELRKRADLAEAARRGFLDRGLGPLAAAVAAEVAVTALHVALDRWLEEDDDRRLYDVVVETLGALRALLAVASEAPHA